jgi:Fe-S oxidoreductase
VLRLVPDLKVETVESSCCGMAGAFGYRRDTIDISLAMAELNLLPAVRNASAETIIVADGTSCRQQIRDGTGRESLHVARVLAANLARAWRCLRSAPILRFAIGFGQSSAAFFEQAA